MHIEEIKEALRTGSMGNEVFKHLMVKHLQVLGTSWDGWTKEVMLHIAGAGNSSGGWGHKVHLVLHGTNSARVYGTFQPVGVMRYGYSIIDHSGYTTKLSNRAQYWRLSEEVNNGDWRMAEKPIYTVELEGSCGGTQEAILSLVRASSDWLI